jgi:hypothetical protein
MCLNFLYFLEKKLAITKRRNSVIFFIICKIFSHGIFYQKLKSASDTEFYYLYDAILEFTKFEFEILMKPENGLL